MGEGGCSLASDRASYEMADPQKLQLHLESRLVLNDELRKVDAPPAPSRKQEQTQVLVPQDFIESLQELIQEPEALRIALLPSNLGSGSPGDSLLRVVLEASPVQTEVAEVLLHRLVECGDEGGEGNSSDGSMALRILSLFRWLNHVVDPNAITRRALEV